MAELINRPQYLNQLIQNKDVDLVKIVTGIRRCGKRNMAVQERTAAGCNGNAFGRRRRVMGNGICCPSGSAGERLWQAVFEMVPGTGV